MRLTLSPYTLDVNADRNRAFYRKMLPITGNCSCAGCRNYAAYAKRLPAELADFFSALGVDPAKPFDAFMNGPHPDGTIYYGGIYHLCGACLSPALKDENALTDADSHWVNETCRVVFVPVTAPPPEGFPEPLLQMELHVNVPWLLDEPNDFACSCQE